ncbi:MAG: hypothetical protein U5J99_08660 [Parvularculaceae bacterium]|nr:hypothetical protein [Parvularculaceae bacterium]
MSRVAVIAALSLLAGAALAQPAPISEAAWLAPEADLVAFLTKAPEECLAEPKDENARYSVAIGRMAFRSPFLLGGQAARGRLSCSACHVNGRANPDFFVEGLSSAPGTADVTTSLFSQVREDRALNARPIPDLVDRAARAEAAHGLEDFIESAVTDEFQGAPPPRAVIDGLVAYVSSLQSSACDGDVVQQSPRRDMRQVARALSVADEALARGDSGVADFALVSAQGELGRIAERYPASPSIQNDLAALSRLIAGSRAIAPEAPKGARVRIDEAAFQSSRLSFALNREREASLYDPETATAWIASSSLSRD